MAKKLTVNMVAMGNLKNRKKHYIGLVTGILLAMIFICGIPFFESCIETSRQEYRYRNLGKQTEMVLDAQNVDMEKVVNSGSLIEKPGYIHISSCIWAENPENSVCVGWMDQQAEKLYYLQMKEGRMPENPDEIALEESALRKLAPNAKPGDVFEVSVGREDAPSTKAYKLVGILQNRKFFLERFGQDLKKLPSAYIAEPDVPAAEEPLIALLNAYEQVDGKKTVYDYCESEKIVPTFMDAFGLDGMERGTATIRLSTQLAKMLAVLSCLGIAGAFYGDLKQRRQQIGMLRAVGATKRQIVILYGREALLLAVVCVPAGVAAAYFSVKLFAFSLDLVFAPDMTILLRGGFISFLAVIVSALIPLVIAAAATPMQAIRNSELMRHMKRRKIRSHKTFKTSGLLARRRLLFYRGQRWLLILILALSIGIFSVYTSRSLFRLEANNEATLHDDYDYLISTRYYSVENTGINEAGINYSISENQRQQCLALPNVANVYASSRGYAHLILDGEMPEYLKLWDTDIGGLGSKYDSPTFDWNWKGTRDQFWEEAHKDLNPKYLYAREMGGYDQETFNLPIYGISQEIMSQVMVEITDGEIHPEKIKSGEEVILCAPKTIGYTNHQTSANTGSVGIKSLSENSQSFIKATDEDRNHLLITADSPFSAGDKLTISVLYDNGEGFIRRTDKEVTIGAIVECVDEGRFTYLKCSSRIGIYTTPEVLNQFGGEFGYTTLYMYLNEECTESIDEEMKRTLEDMFPGQSFLSTFATKEWYREDNRNEVISLITLFVVFTAGSAGLLANSIASQIRESMRVIGTLRALGANQKVLIRSYLDEIIIVCVSGGSLGIGGFLIYEGICIMLRHGYGLGFNCIPAIMLLLSVLVCCCISLWVQVRKFSKFSIVENIREMG